MEIKKEQYQYIWYSLYRLLSESKDPKIIRKLGTPRPLIIVKDCLPKWMNFKHPEFDKLISFFKESKILNGNTKGVLTFSLIFQ